MLDWDDKQQRAKFLEAFATANELLISKEFTEGTPKAYFKALSKYDIGQVVAAFDSAITRLKFFPQIVELIEFIDGDNKDRQLQGDAQAQEVLLAVRRYGRYANVQFADPVTNAVVKTFFGGWLNMCNLDEKNQIFFVKDFRERYADYKHRGVEDREPMYGVGTDRKVEMIGGTSQQAIECNGEGRKKVAGIVNGATFKQRQAFRDGAPFHELVKKD